MKARNTGTKRTLKTLALAVVAAALIVPAASAESNIMKTKHDTVKNTISNVR